MSDHCREGIEHSQGQEDVLSGYIDSPCIRCPVSDQIRERIRNRERGLMDQLSERLQGLIEKLRVVRR